MEGHHFTIKVQKNENKVYPELTDKEMFKFTFLHFEIDTQIGLKSFLSVNWGLHKLRRKNQC